MTNSGTASLASKNVFQKVALFGGTFDPIHDGHLFIASEAQRQCNLDEVIIIPCWQSPHKPGIKATDSRHRVEMAKLAVADHAWATVSDFEATRTEPSFSWQTAQYFSGKRPNSQLFWILGADQWQVIDSWGCPGILAELLTFIVFGRNGMIPQPTPPFNSVLLPGTFDVSATEIRNALAKPAEIQEIRGMNARVLEYLHKHRLYSTNEGS
ncbi:MAG: nicotinate-nucleotide adenylyltransferase [Verrucomicrobiales bacterium]|jgi:nicotinate-nucleotide adenylyltransferase